MSSECLVSDQLTREKVGKMVEWESGRAPVAKKWRTIKA